MKVFSENCLAGGTYLVTGASSGIGRAAALLIAQCGGRVIASGRDAERLQAAVAALPGAGHAQSVMVLQDADQTADWIKELVTRHGALSGLFHAAGTDLVRPARLCKQAHLDAIFGSSLYAAFGIARAVNQKNIMQDGGSIVFMSSAASTTGQSGMTVYSAAKAGINGMVRPLACEMGPRRIRVNAIVAGAAMTAMHERLLNISNDVATSDYETNHLLGFGEAQDVANAAVFLLSPAARWITGTNMVVDGGYSL